MNLNLIRLTRMVDFQMIKDQKIAPIDVYREQVENWVFKPAKILAQEYINDTDVGMGLLSTILVFFEPHGEYLRGEKGEKESGLTFRKAFDDYLQYIKIPEKLNDTDATEFYKFARCGLFHSGIIGKGILVDSVHCTDFPIQKIEFDKKELTLVNPQILLESLQEYFSDYIKYIRENPDSEKALNFEKTYNKLIIEAMEYYERI